MQIVIDVPEKDVPNSQEIMTINLHFIAGEVCECSYPYMVLPKGHGRLIDAELLDKKRIDYIVDGYANDADDCAEFGMMIILAPTIVEADGGDAE